MNFDSLGQYGNSAYSPSSYLPAGFNTAMGQTGSGFQINDFMRNSLSGLSSGAQREPSFLDKLIGTSEQPGWGNLALGGLQAGAGAYLGFQQLGLAKKQLKESRRQFDLNFNAQRNTTNAALSDRQRARLAADPNGYESVSSYMNKYGV